MARTLVTGNILRSGSIPTTALGGGVVTSSLQIVASLPTGSLSSSAQVNYPDISNIPGGIASSSAQIKDYLPVDSVSSSAQVTAFLPTGTVSSSGQVSYLGLSNIPSGIASSSGQIKDYLPVDTVSSSQQVTAFLPANTVSSSGQISLSGISGTTFSNNDFNFPLNVTINGLLTATSQSIVYITSSQLNVGSNDIILNTTEQLRFGGLTVFDSGSANQSGSLFWDSLNNVWLYVHAGTSNTSSILITGPENTGVLGSEAFLTTNRVPKAGINGDHIIDSQISDNGTTVGITGNLSVTGSVSAGSYTGSLSGSSITANTLTISGTAGASIARINATQDQSILSFTDTQDNTGYFSIRSAVEAGEQGASFFADGALFFGRLISGSFTERMRIDSSGNTGIGTTNPGSKLQVDGQVRIINGSGNNPGGYLWIEDQNGLTYSATSENTPSLTVKNEQSGANRVSTLRLSARDSGGGLSNWNISSIGVGSNRGVLAIQNGNVECIRVDSSGYILVNATSSIGVGDSRLQIGNGTTGGSTQLLLKTTAGHTALYSTTSSNTYLTWASGGFFALGIAPTDGSTFTEYMRIDTSGNLGVGTTSTGADGIALNNTRNYSWAEGSGDSYANIFRQRNTAATVVASGYKRSATGLFASSYGTSMARAAIAVGYNNGSIAFFSDSATNIANGTDMSPTERVTILNNGNVGIGTGSPAGPLQVVATGGGSVGTINIRGSNAHLGLMNSSGQFRGWFGYFNAAPHGSETDLNIKTGYNGTSNIRISANGDSTPAQLYIANSGNIGIGTTNPTYKFHVYNTVENFIARFTGGSSSNINIGVFGNTASSFGSIGTESNHDFNIFTNGTDRIYIKSGGNVGIGTGSPAYTLDVIGQIKGDAFLGKNFDSYSYSAGTLTLNTVTGSGPRLYNYVIRANPNSGGSSSYSDFLYGKIIIGTGWNGSAVTNFINVVQENPNPRDLYGSGGGNLTVDAVFFTSAEFTSLASGTSYTIRLKISGFSADPNGITALISQIGI